MKIEIVLKTIGGVSFASMRNYNNQKGETATYLFNIGESYANAKAKDIKTLENLKVTDISHKGIDVSLFEQAREALLAALKKPSKARSKGQTEAYEPVLLDGEPITGLKQHVDTGERYLYGQLVRKFDKTPKEVREALDSVDTRGELTKVKDRIRKECMRSAKYRQFKLGSQDGSTFFTEGKEFAI